MKNILRGSLLRLLVVTVLVWMAGATVPALASPPAGVAVGPASMVVPSALQIRDFIRDGSFEVSEWVPGPDKNPFWEEYSTQFGTPLCRPVNCYAYAHTGSWWAWFGGTIGLEQAAITQTVHIPTGPAQLHFFVWMEYSPSPGFVTDTLRLLVDGNTLWSTNGTDTAYTAGYTGVTVDLAAYADGQSHTITFASLTNDAHKGTGFLLDDVALYWQPSSQIMLPLLRKAL